MGRTDEKVTLRALDRGKRPVIPSSRLNRHVRQVWHHTHHRRPADVAQRQGDRYGFLRLVVGAGSVAGVMFAWLGFARASDVRIEAWELQRQVEETPPISTPISTELPTAVSAATPTPTARPTDGTHAPGTSTTEPSVVPAAPPSATRVSPTAISATEMVEEDPTTQPTPTSRARTSRGS